MTTASWPRAQVLKKKAKGKSSGPPKMLTKREPCASFFNFFAPPQEPAAGADVDEDELEELRGALEEDFEQGCGRAADPVGPDHPPVPYRLHGRLTLVCTL